MFFVQNTFFEWLVVENQVLGLLASALGLFVLPTLLHELGAWQRGSWQPLLGRGVSWAADLALMYQTWSFMVRGPVYRPLPAGSLAGQVCIITGCNTGIGFEAADVLARAG